MGNENIDWKGYGMAKLYRSQFPTYLLVVANVGDNREIEGSASVQKMKLSVHGLLPVNLA